MAVLHNVCYNKCEKVHNLKFNKNWNFNFRTGNFATKSIMYISKYQVLNIDTVRAPDFNW